MCYYYTLVLNKCHDVNHLVKRVWLCTTMKLPRLILVAATTAAGLITTTCRVIKDTTPRLPFISSVMQ